MKQVYVKDNEGILLGRVGENEAVQVVWSGVAAEFESAYGKGVFMLTAQRGYGGVSLLRRRGGQQCVLDCPSGGRGTARLWQG